MMSAEDDSKDPGWLQKLKSEGSVPLLPLDDSVNGWAPPPGDNFLVRGPDYLASRTKIPAGDWLLKPLAFDWIKSSTPIHDVFNHPNARVKVAVEGALEGPGENGVPFVWVFNLQVPSKDNYSAIAYFVSFESIAEGSLMQRFLLGDDDFRNSRLKLIANIVNGPWIVKTAVGEQAICILGRAVSCKYHQGVNFMEVDVDIGGSMFASAVVHLAFGYITTLTVDLAFIIEGQTDDELPERILGAVRMINLDPASATSVDLPAEEDDSYAEVAPSLTSRLWKSFSTYINGEEYASETKSPSMESSEKE